MNAEGAETEVIKLKEAQQEQELKQNNRYKMKLAKHQLKLEVAKGWLKISKGQQQMSSYKLNVIKGQLNLDVQALKRVKSKRMQGKA